MIGVCEAVAYAKKAGLNPDKVLESISTGARGSWSLSNLAPRMLKGDFEPGFYVKHFMKDMKIALEEAEKLQLPVPGLSLAKELYEELIKDGEENSGTQVLYKKYIRGKRGGLQKFDEMIDTVQRATCMQINEKQKEAFKQKYDFEPNLNMEEMRRDIM